MSNDLNPNVAPVTQTESKSSIPAPAAVPATPQTQPPAGKNRQNRSHKKQPAVFAAAQPAKL
jgi:hypothetical protein